MIDVSRIARNNVTLFATLLPRAMVVVGGKGLELQFCPSLQLTNDNGIYFADYR